MPRHIARRHLLQCVPQRVLHLSINLLRRIWCPTVLVPEVKRVSAPFPVEHVLAANVEQSPPVPCVGFFVVETARVIDTVRRVTWWRIFDAVPGVDDFISDVGRLSHLAPLLPADTSAWRVDQSHQIPVSRATD